MTLTLTPKRFVSVWCLFALCSCVCRCISTTQLLIVLRVLNNCVLCAPDRLDAPEYAHPNHPPPRSTHAQMMRQELLSLSTQKEQIEKLLADTESKLELL
ncbi:unnamed protein product [Ectocarpus sp. 12 AP-2014]